MKATLTVTEPDKSFTVTYGADHFETVEKHLGQEIKLERNVTEKEGELVSVFKLEDGRLMRGATEGLQVRYEVETEDDKYDRQYLETELGWTNQDSKY